MAVAPTRQTRTQRLFGQAVAVVPISQTRPLIRQRLLSPPLKHDTITRWQSIPILDETPSLGDGSCVAFEA